MSELSPTTAIGSFSDRRHAHLAVEELMKAGFAVEDIGFIMPEGDPVVETPLMPPRGNMAEEGAATGAVAGGAVGGLIGTALATSLIPGVGPVIAGGLLVGAVSGVVTGLAGGGLLGALVGLSVPEEQAKRHERNLYEGQTIVTVKAGDRYDEALAILERANSTPELTDANPRSRLSSMSEGGGSSGTGSAFTGDV